MRPTERWQGRPEQHHRPRLADQGYAVVRSVAGAAINVAKGNRSMETKPRLARGPPEKGNTAIFEWTESIQEIQEDNDGMLY